MRLPGREVCLRGLFRGSVSWYVSGVCFGGLFRTVLLPRTVKFKGSVSGSVSKVCFGVCFGGLFRQSRTSQPYLKLHSPKKCKPILISQGRHKAIPCLRLRYKTLVQPSACTFKKFMGPSRITSSLARQKSHCYVQMLQIMWTFSLHHFRIIRIYPFVSSC